MTNFLHLQIVQLVYFAAFIDCDGSIIAQIKSGEYALGYRIAISICFHQKKARNYFLRKIQRELKAGVLRDRGNMSDLTIQGNELIYQFLLLIKPYVRIKSKQLNLMVRLIEQMPQAKRNPAKFLELCELADRIESFNDSRNRTVTAKTVREAFIRKALIPVETSTKC